MERVFHDVRSAMPEGLIIKQIRNARLSKGILPRLLDALSARNNASEINHVLGDVHYLTYFLPSQRTLLTVHDTGVFDRARGWKRVIFWFFWFWLPTKRSARLTTISEHTKQQLLSMVSYDPDRIHVIPNPIAPQFVAAPIRPREGTFRLLHIGTKANKNLERLIEAISGMDIELTVIGHMNSAQKDVIHKHKIQHRNLANLSEDELSAEYERCEALAFVSLSEGFGLPIIEAQATGRPVLTSQLPPMDDVAGTGAIFVDPTNVAKIREAVSRLMRDGDLRESLIRRGQANVRRFDPVVIAARYAELYRLIASEASTNI